MYVFFKTYQDKHSHETIYCMIIFDKNKVDFSDSIGWLDQEQEGKKEKTIE